MSVNQTIVVKKRYQDFTAIPNSVIFSHLSFEALGLYTYLRGLPPDWKFYNQQLCSRGNIGRKKLESLLKELETMNLIKRSQIRTEKGQFSHLDIEIFDPNPEWTPYICEDSPMCPKPTSVNGSSVKSSYIKSNNTKLNDNNFIDTSSDDEDKRTFNLFWEVWPNKQGKMEAQKAWKRKKLGKFINEIIRDIQVRLASHGQWRHKQFIPHASTYLNQERWTDEIVPHLENKESIRKIYGR